MKQCKNLDPLPLGWLDELQTKADLERAFALLRPVRYFYAEAWKGRLRSLQLRWDTAYKHFHKAYKLAADAEESLPVLVHKVHLSLWSFENALIANVPDEDSEPEPEEDWGQGFPEDAIDEHPELRAVEILGRKADALRHLHSGEHGVAAAIYQELLENKHVALHTPEEITFLHLGLAACEHNLGFADRALRSLENGGLSAMAGTKALYRLTAASILHAFYRLLDRAEDAQSWKDVIDRFDGPEATRRALLRRSDLIVERSEQAEAFLIL